MTNHSLLQLADTVGVSAAWRDVQGVSHQVAEPTLKAVLAALGHAVATESQVQDSIAALAALPQSLPPLITAQVGHRIWVSAKPARTKLTLEDGRVFEGFAGEASEGAFIPPILEPGYHDLEFGDQLVTVAVAPARCTTLRDIIPNGRCLALAAQVYALRRHGDAGIGDFAALGDFVEAAGRHRVDAVAISPVHAQFSADSTRYSPYAPSSRVALNILHAPIDLYPGHRGEWGEQADTLEMSTLVNWPAAAEARLARLRSIFAQASGQRRWMEPFQAFRATQGESLERHAVFEALHAHFFKTDQSLWDWRRWPEPFRSPSSPAVASFAREFKRQVDFHAFLQFLANRGLANAQSRARSAGMQIGLISDLAVGTDGGGSHCWSRQQETLPGVTIGAPPDMFQQAGQNWGLAAFSPRGLESHGYKAFLEMVQAAFAHSGGVRIDHSMGLHRLWVIPEGGKATEGAYLKFPETDLLRLIALESFRAKAIVIAEDLGTLPDGFQQRIQNAGIFGMRVLWFERAGSGQFTQPDRWERNAAGMTTTHDLPTVAGWWTGRDLAWREHLEPDFDRAHAESERVEDRHRLWETMRESGAAQGDEPEPHAAEDAVDAALTHVATSQCDLVILPIEDILGLAEQPNLPNTIDEHPNWRRRLTRMAADVLDDEIAATRLKRVVAGRVRPEHL